MSAPESELSDRTSSDVAASDIAAADVGAGGAGYEVVWTPEPSSIDPEAELPERYELARDFGDGVVGPAFGVRDRDDENRWLRLELVPSRLVATDAQVRALEEHVAAARKVVSAHVARMRDIGRLSDGRSFVTSDAVHGETLAQRLARERSLHPRQALEIARQTLLGLATAHEQGVEHGSLSTRSIWLASGAPKTDEDPHGVAVRIADLGLARFAALGAREVGSRPFGRADVVAVLEMLRMMVPPDCEHPLCEGIERLVALRSGAGDAESLLNAPAMLAEVERLIASAPAPGRAAGRRPARRWIAPLAAGLAAVALFEAVMIWRGRGDVRASDDELARRTARLESAIETNEKRIAELSSQRDEALKLGEQVDETNSVLAAERLRGQELAAELAKLRAERDEALEVAASTEEGRAALAKRIERLEGEATPTARAARNFDAAIAAIVALSGEEAQRRLHALESEGMTCPPYVRELAHASTALERFGRSRLDAALDVEALRHTDQALQRAEAARDTLDEDSGAWLAHGEPGASVRIGRVQSAHASLRESLALARAEAVEVDRAEWSAIAAEPGIQDPQAAFAHSERFGCAHLSELAARFANELRAWVVVEEGLDVERLGTFTHLPSWLERLTAGRATLPARERRELELFAHAQRWYDGDPANDALLDGSTIEAGPVFSLRHDWRAELRLLWQLSREDSAYPIRRDALAIFRSVDPDGVVEWWRETPETVTADAWRIRRERLSEDGSTPVGEGTLKIERRGPLFAIPGANLPLLDLRAHGQALLVSPHPVQWDGDLPQSLAVSEPELEGFRRARASDPCLVYAQDDVRRWISPTLGLVREETRTQRGWFSRDLVYARPGR